MDGRILPEGGDWKTQLPAGRVNVGLIRYESEPIKVSGMPGM